MSPCDVIDVGHRPRGEPGERWGADYVAKRDRCRGGGSHGGGGLVNREWKSWNTTAPRQGGEGGSKRCVHETNIEEYRWVSFKCCSE